MTSPAIKLANVVFADPAKVPAFQNGFWTITTEELTHFYALAQAQALRDAADRFEETDPDTAYRLRRMAGELERRT